MQRGARSLPGQLQIAKEQAVMIIECEIFNSFSIVVHMNTLSLNVPVVGLCSSLGATTRGGAARATQRRQWRQGESLFSIYGQPSSIHHLELDFSLQKAPRKEGEYP